MASVLSTPCYQLLCWDFQILGFHLLEQSMHILPSHSQHWRSLGSQGMGTNLSPAQGKLFQGFVLQDRGTRSSVPAQAQTLRSCWCSMETAGDGWGTVRWEIPKCQTAYRLLLPWDPTVNISLISYPTGWYSHGMARRWQHNRLQHNTAAKPPALPNPAQGAA